MCEAGIHTMSGLPESEGTEAVVLVHTSNAFNSLNREAVLRNVCILCPVLALILVNTYGQPSGYSLMASTSGLRRVPCRVTPWP